MKAKTNEWQNWYGDTLQIEVDIEMLNFILVKMDKQIEMLVAERLYPEANALIKDRIILEEKYAERKPDPNA